MDQEEETFCPLIMRTWVTDEESPLPLTWMLICGEEACFNQIQFREKSGH